MTNINLARLIFFITLSLFIFGLIMLTSASFIKGIQITGDSMFYLKKQLFGGGLLGILAFLLASAIDYNVWRKSATLFLIICIVLLILVFQPVGLKFGGSASWINLGPVTLQPSELAKIGLIFYLSAWLSAKREKLKTLEYGLLGFCLIVASVGILILLQPDFGTLFIILGVALILFLLGGAKISHVALLILMGLILFTAIVSIYPDKLERVKVFLEKDSDPLGKGYQIRSSLVAVGSGGIIGKGLGHSTQKWNFLPEPATDTIFAIIAEELGFIGASSVVIVLLFLGMICFIVASRAQDFFAKLCASGIGSLILLQSFVNIGGTLNLFPFTGITLPLISHGGTSLVVTLFALGVMVNIARQQK